jgi:hypothetical protein
MYLMTPMTVGTLGYLGVASSITFAMDARTVFGQLIDGQRTIIRAHVRCVGMTLCTGVRDIEGVDQRGTIRFRAYSMRTMARRTLCDPILPCR